MAGSSSLPGARGGRRPRIALLVFNDASTDARVLKTADALAASGAVVRLVAFSAHLQAAPGLVARGRDVEILRVPVLELDHAPARAGAWARRQVSLLRRGRGDATPPVGAPRSDGPGTTNATPAPVELRGAKGTVVDLWMRMHHTLRLASYHARSYRALVSWRPDAIHANDANTLVPAWAAARRLGVPFVYDSHELWTHRIKAGHRPVARRWEAFVERRLAPRAAAVVTVSPSIAHRLKDVLRLRELPTLVRNVPVRSGEPDPSQGSLRRLAGLSPQDRVVVHIGAVTIGRGLEQLLSVLSRLPADVHLVLLGPASSTFVEKLDRRAESLGVGLRVHAVGAVPPEQVAQAAADADVSVVSIEPLTLSLRFSLPNKLFESLHAGLPIVASDLPDIGQVVTDAGAGVVVDFSDPSAAARRILDTLEDGDAYRTAARAAARSLTWQSEVQNLVEVYRRVLLPGTERRSLVHRAVAAWTKHRRRLPPGLGAVVDRAVHQFPDPLRDAYDRAVFGFSAADEVAPPPLPSSGRRLYVAPTNYAGQGDAYARAVERHGGVGAVSMKASPGPGTLLFPADMVVGKSVYLASRGWQRRQREYVSQFTHVIVESGQTLYSPAVPGAVESEVRDLLDHGVRVALLFHGSDVRLPSAHLEREPWSHFAQPPFLGAERYEEQARRNRALADELGTAGVLTFVTTPDLLTDVPSARWVPVVVDPARWSDTAREDVLTRRVPVVVHAPSRSAVKGTDLVEPGLVELDRRGLIEYRRAEGLSWRDMPAFYGDADVVLDQFRVGNYGVAACEAMASGRLVVSYVSTDVRAEVRRASGLDLPVVQSTGPDVVRVLSEILEDREAARDVALRGRSFVATVHDGTRSAEVLSAFIEGDA
ncbi:glycosyltransferase [Cellulosimicrobium sp. ES-005]|uniref:Glycosyltransferase n=1 Tax=Cellulosimicrobium sp. ES-005 TaxID=3163031 RepID=A0AAU8G348_9MICO